MSSLDVIVTMANALSKASVSNISELRIIYTLKSDCFKGELTLANGSQYNIYDTGAVGIITKECIGG